MWATMCSTVRSSGEPGAGSPPADGRVVAASMADDEAGPNPDVRERAYVGERCPHRCVESRSVPRDPQAQVPGGPSDWFSECSIPTFSTGEPSGSVLSP